jgi:short-subunit dehydrogenase
VAGTGRQVAIAGKRILVTGASSGIGCALAVELAARGAELAVAARRADLLERLADELEAGGSTRPVVLETDLVRRGAAAELADRALSELGAVDVLVNNAGGGVGGAQWVVGDGDAAREAFEVNLWSPLALVQALVPAMRERGNGVVVNVTSTGQAAPLWGMGHYLATKAALATATEVLRLELHGSGVHVLEAIPGPVDTPVQGETRLIPGIESALKGSRIASPEEIARAIAVAIERGRTRLVRPRRLRIPYVLPGLGRWRMQRLIARLAERPGFDPVVPTAIRSGSMGDPVARDARDAWERAHGRG